MRSVLCRQIPSSLPFSSFLIAFFSFGAPQIQNLHPDKCVLMMETLLNNISHDGESRVDKETNEKYVIEVDTRCFDMIPKLLLTISSAPLVKNPSKRQEDTGLEYQ